MLPILVLLALEYSPWRAALSFPLSSYLGFHTAVELIAMTMGLVCFGLLWLTPATAVRTSTVALACAVAAASGLDMLHMLSYAGMPALVTPSSPEKAIAFWLAGRSALALGVLVAAWAPLQRMESPGRRYLWLTLTLAATLGVSVLILLRPDDLPRTYLPGAGLTSFKVAFELVLVGINLLAAARLQRVAGRVGTPAVTLAVSAMFCAVAELCFASYASPSDMLNALGHVAKILAYAYLVRTAYLLSLRLPLARAGGLADALTASGNPTLICSELGTIHWVNPAFSQVTGYELGELRGRSLASLCRDDDSRWPEQQAAMASGRSWQGHVSMRRKDGSAYLDDRRLTPIRNALGHLNAYVMTGEDITEREAQARALAAGEERLRALLASAPDAVIVIDRAGTMLLVNEAAQLMFGHAREAMVGQNIRMLMPAEMAGLHDGHLERYAQTGDPRIIGRGRDVEGLHRDGRPLELHLTVGEACLPDGKVYIGFMRDIREQRQAQRALAEREQRYRALMDTAMDGVLLCDLEGRLVEVNDAYVRLSGYSRDELKRMKIVDLQAELDATGVAGRIRHVVQHGNMQFETRHRSKQGVVWPVEISVAHWAVDGGQLFIFARDLSSRKAAERALRESEERLALALRGTNDGLWDYDFLEQSLFLSPRWKEMLGYADPELPSQLDWVRRLLHPEDALSAHAAVSDLLAGRAGDRFEVELRLRHKAGHWVPVLCRGQLVRDESGQALRLIGTHQDLSERHRAEQSLRESEDKLRSLFELSPLGIAMCTMEGRLVEFNEAYRSLLGFDAATLRGMTYWELTPPEYVQAEAEQLEAVAHTGRYGPYEKEYLCADGSRVPVRMNGVRIELDGQPYLWSIAEDLTAQRRTEAERQAMQQQQMQSQKLEALGQLTGGIAHDFNNMLGGILGLASLGLERHIEDPDSKLAQYLREIVRTSERGRDLVAKMLAYVRTGEPTVSPPHALQPIVGEVCDLLRASLPEGVSLDCRCPEPVPPARISAVDLHQIVMNLVLNARDAVGPGGRIEVVLRHDRRAPSPPAHCSHCHQPLPGDCVVLEVRDNGPGIPPELLPRIFDPFFTTKAVGKGTGLGLASVTGLVHRAGGHVQAIAPAEGGTLMRMLLPAAGEAVAAPAPVPPVPLSLPAGGAVWVVDDDPAVLVFLTELLRENGFEVQAFGDPQPAIDALRAVKPRPDAHPVALITDQTMPGLSGAKLAQAALALLPGLPVVLCTGYSEHIDAESARTLGVRCFLRKPFDSQELLAALAGVLPEPR
nr:PAS domain S-box protein [Ideonella oryzae]